MVDRQGERAISKVPRQALHTLWGDLGIRPSDLLQSDIVFFVEGKTDVIFIEHVLHLYEEEFAGLAVQVVQYGGGAAHAISGGDISIQNLSAANGYIFWLTDKDAGLSEQPSSEIQAFETALSDAGQECHVWTKREIEFYFPEAVLVAAQNGNAGQVEKVREVLLGSQEAKFASLAAGCQIPRGGRLRELLQTHVTNREHLDLEVRAIFERVAMTWARSISGT